MPKKKPKTGKPQVHEDLKGFEVKINEFGEITSNMDVQKLNNFLNKNVDDKKFRERDDVDEIKKGHVGTDEEDDELDEDIDDLESGFEEEE